MYSGQRQIQPYNRKFKSIEPDNYIVSNHVTTFYT